MIFEAIFNLSNKTEFHLNGVSMTYLERLESLESRLAAALELLDQIPEDQDFLQADDIQPLFNNREVIFDV